MKSKEQKKGKVKKQHIKPRNKNWFGVDNEDYAITETIRKKGRLGGRKLG